jgi:Asp-tRNA(Asn)/Glu-tRNA(Gln) amidotransferase A subunit family amidase
LVRVASGYPRDAFSLPRVTAGRRASARELKGLRVAVVPDRPAQSSIPSAPSSATRTPRRPAGLRRVDATSVAGRFAWANAGAPGLYGDLKDHWPACENDLTFEIKFAMRFMETYRVWHAASSERFRMEMNEAFADVFERVDVVLSAVSPVEPFAAEGPMPTKVGEIAVNPFNGGALTIPASISGYPAISIPAGLSASGLPIGLQAIARRHEDALLLDLALVMERVRPWPLTAPGAPA